MAFLEGFLMGLGTIIFMGPVFFTLLQTTLQRGVKDGLSVALGIIASDILIVTLFYIGFIDYFRQPNVQFWFAIIGSVILLGLGLSRIFSTIQTLL
ncbi:MAG: LysE family transporter [Bacteroidetes bacterium]|nr:LysE family transporter [Bacteroidota bacterium]